MGYASSASRTWSELRSTSLKTAAERMPSSRQARRMRTAISPRLAMRILRNMTNLKGSGGVARGAGSQRRCYLLACLNVSGIREASFDKGVVGTMNRKLAMACVVLLLTGSALLPQESVVSPPESIVAEGVPKVPAALAETAGRYGAYRSAGLADWNPTKREMLVATRFGDTPQLHLVSAPGAARRQ